MSHIPLIDFAGFAGGSEAHRRAIADRVNRAAIDVGFMYAKNLGIDPDVRAEAFASSKAFFRLPDAEKLDCAYASADANHGFQGVGVERLSAGQPPDLKEIFTMRDVPKTASAPDVYRWPSPAFSATALRMFDECLGAAKRVMEAFAITLDVPQDFFAKYHTGGCATLRYLHYPMVEGEVEVDQLGAGAHTDYGTLTLLFQEDVGGLQVLDAQDNWRDAPPIPETVVVNTGDLMARWTNTIYRSTLHRVRPMTGERDRYAIAFFADPDSDTPVRVLPSCCGPDNPAKFPETTAGEHILAKIRASHV